MRLIALATCYALPQLYPDEAPLVKALHERGWQAIPTIWNSPEIDWASYEAVIVRNTWDYHEQPDVFRSWLDHLETLGVPVINPPDVLRWNMDKLYLRQLADDGLPVLDARFIERGTSANLAEILTETGWRRAVVKPTISNGGINAFTVAAENIVEAQKRFDALLKLQTLIVQRYAEAISGGEMALVFFGGDYNHAVLKRPAAGGWLVHEEWGGSNELTVADPAHIAQAAAIVTAAEKHIGTKTAYARVDGVLVDGVFTLMELELMEPELYFSRVASAADRFLDVVAGILT